MKDKTYILDRFVPALNLVLMRAAPSGFARWFGSACRQTAVLVAHEMSQRIDCPWHVFEGRFVGSPRGRKQEYEHAWVWGECGLFIDANHRREHRVWAVGGNGHPSGSVFARRWTEIGRIELPWLEMLDDVEYYTSMPGRVVHSMVKAVADNVTSSFMEEYEQVYETIRPEWMDA